MAVEGATFRWLLSRGPICPAQKKNQSDTRTNSGRRKGTPAHNKDLGAHVSCRAAYYEPFSPHICDNGVSALGRATIPPIFEQQPAQETIA